MTSKEVRPLSKVEKYLLALVCLIAIASWFNPKSSWYDPILIFMVAGGMVVFIGDALHKRRQEAPSVAPQAVIVSSSMVTPVAPRNPQYSTDLMQATAAPDLSDKTRPSDVLVCIHGLDEDTTERMERLCKALGLSVILQANASADMAVVGSGSAFDFAGAKIPTYDPAEFSDVVHRALEKFALLEDEPQRQARNSKPPAIEHLSTLDDAATTPATTKRKRLTRSPTANDPTGVYYFTYERSDGTVRPRQVKILRATFSRGAKYFAGVCLDANASRTFRADRVVGKLTCEDTGEMIGPAELYSAFEAVGQTGQEVHFLNGLTTGGTNNRSRAAKKEWVTSVFFAGFRGGKLDELEGLADAAGWQVRNSISHTVDYVVRNGSAGKNQLAEAGKLGISVIDEDEYRQLL